MPRKELRRHDASLPVLSAKGFPKLQGATRGLGRFPSHAVPVLPHMPAVRALLEWKVRRPVLD
jgi:hypothetical protein